MAVVRHGPAFLNGCLNLFGVETCSLGLLPFVEREIAGIAQAGIPKPLRHLPAVFEIEFLGDRSEEHTSELQSLMRISYAVFCLKKTKYLQTTRLISTYLSAFIRITSQGV